MKWNQLGQLGGSDNIPECSWRKIDLCSSPKSENPQLTNKKGKLISIFHKAQMQSEMIIVTTFSTHFIWYISWLKQTITFPDYCSLLSF